MEVNCLHPRLQQTPTNQLQGKEAFYTKNMIKTNPLVRYGDIHLKSHTEGLKQ